MIRLGVPQSGYNVDRNILWSKPPWARRVRPLDGCRLVSALWFRAMRRLPHPVGFRFTEPYLPRADLFHFFNSLASIRAPWITTFEHRLPRWERADESIRAASCRAGLDLILAEPCRSLVAFSDASRNIAIRDWECRFGSAEAALAAAKVRILRPPQSILGGATPRSGRERPLFAFIGGDFFRKGGLQTVEALERLYARGVRDWDAIVVGRLDSFGDYASATDAASAAAVKAAISRMSDRVTHHERMRNADVLQLLARADYYLFPTLADTFGYSVLEAMASGAVVITTNVRSLPEVVDDETGYLIRLPLDANREIHRRPDFAVIKSLLTDELEHAIYTALFETEATRLRKAKAAVARLQAAHDPAAHAIAIEHVYRSALGMEVPADG